MNAIPVSSAGLRTGRLGTSLLLFAAGWLLLALVALPLPPAAL
jgi:hypothetical protein